MGEFAAKFRPEVDLDEFERRLRAAAPAPQPRAEGADPLAELARLVSGESMTRKDDPFEALFRAQSAAGENRHAPEPAAPQSQQAAGAEAFSHFSLREPYFADQPPAEQPPHWATQAYHGENQAYQGESYASDPLPYQESEPTWAHEAQAPDAGAQAWPAAYDEAAPAAAPAPVFRRKVMYGMGAVLVAGVLGIAGTLALRGKSSNHDVVTIQADSDPAKVKPAQADNADTPSGGALFDRKSTGNVSKVVGNAEQPADLGATVKNARVVGSAAGVETPAPPSPSGAAAPAPNGPQTEAVFPAPKKVKTVSVRADGTVIDGADSHPPIARTLPSLAAGAVAPPVAPTSTHTPAVKSTERASSTNEAALKAPAHAPSAAAQPAKPAAREAAGEGGGFAVQLAGTPSEAEARAAATALSSKYASALQGHRPSFVQAKVGDKTIYRVRVGRLSEENAKSMCSAIKAQGGNCFVAKN